MGFVMDVDRERESHHARHLEAINQIARIATLDLEPRPMTQRITDALSALFGWEFVALVSVDDDRTRFVCEAVTTERPTEIHPGYTRPLGSGVVGEVAATGKAILLDDVSTWPNYVETMPGTRSELCVPVKHGSRLVGILNLESTRPAAFHEQVPLLTTVADQIAGAIANARLFAETREHARLMEMMSELSRTALEADTLPELIQRAVDYVQRHFPVSRVSIRLRDGEAHAGEAVEHPSRFEVPIRFRATDLGVFSIETPASIVFSRPTALIFQSIAIQMAGAIHLATLKRDLELSNAHLSRAIETLHRISTTDPLTGVANRRQFDTMLDTEWRRATRRAAPITLLMIDIDNFKAFNDAYGHQMGDECLRRVAESLQSQVHRAGELVARYGGEEFAVLIPIGEHDDPSLMAERLRLSVSDLDIGHQYSRHGVVTISIGVATMTPSRKQSADELVRAADEALYRAKNAGRNRIEISA